MNDINETETEVEVDNLPTEPCDDYPGTFFKIIRMPPNLNDTWSLN